MVTMSGVPSSGPVYVGGTYTLKAHTMTVDYV